MVKSEIIKRLKSKHPKLTIEQLENIFNAIFNTITNSLVQQQPIELRNFGRFQTKKVKAKHNSRNPKTNEKIYVPERKKAYFKMSKNLKNEINK